MGDPVGVNDVRVARVGRQRLLPSAGRSAMALGLLHLFHERSPFLIGLAGGANVIDVRRSVT
jgi:hypothetical protein